jgi:hypothetical protein
MHRSYAPKKGNLFSALILVSVHHQAKSSHLAMRSSQADHGWEEKRRPCRGGDPMTENPYAMADRLVPDRTALIVVDVQRYFVHPEYPFGKWVTGLTGPTPISNECAIW